VVRPVCPLCPVPLKSNVALREQIGPEQPETLTRCHIALTRTQDRGAKCHLPSDLPNSEPEPHGYSAFAFAFDFGSKPGQKQQPKAANVTVRTGAGQPPYDFWYDDG
jgi:hypothetical protein